MTAVRKLIGLLLIIAAIIGLVFSVAGIVGIWQVEKNIISGVATTIDLLGQTLETTSQGLSVTQVALKSSMETISGLESTVETIAATVKSSAPMVGDIKTLVTKDIPMTIQATEESMIAAKNSAAIIDSVLGALSSIPFVGSSVGYNPEVPLSDALGQVADSLRSLPDSLIKMETSLSETNSNLETFESDLTIMARSIGQIESSVAEYDSVILGYKRSLDQIKTSLDGIKAGLPDLVRYLILALTVFLVWMAIANFGLLTQGWELFTEARQKSEPKLKPEEELKRGSGEEQPSEKPE